MLYFGYDNSSGKLIYVGDKDPSLSIANCTCVYRWSWHDKQFSVVEAVARDATELTGKLHIAIDNGASVSPRYDVIETPIVGQPVSYGFNGDYYPDGNIVKISDSLRRIETDTGSVYYRRRQSGTWIKKGGTWAMVHGHIDRRNPEF